MAKPLIWAHRGASAIRPENTLESFSAAAELGADGVELDIQLTRDGHIVVCHDETLDRTSDGTGYLKDHTLDELRRMDFSATHPECGTVRIPTMREVFELLKPTGLTINVELKTGAFDYPGIEGKICDLTHDMGMQDRVIYSSFNHASVMRLKGIDPAARTAFLFMDGTLDMSQYATGHGVDALHPWFANLRFPHFMDDCRRTGLEVNAWTVDDERIIRLCTQLGVHAVITNKPDETRRIVDEQAYTPEFEALENGVDAWLARHVEQRTAVSSDGTRIAVHCAERDDARGAVMIVHGFCEFFGKYHFVAKRLYDAGYSVYFVTLRGHGESGRERDYGDSRVYVADFEDYVADVKAAYDQVIRPASPRLPVHALAHSMGGCVMALYLAEHSGDVDCAALSSSMLGLADSAMAAPGSSGGAGADGMAALAALAASQGDDAFAIGQSEFTGLERFEDSSEMDLCRFNRQQAMRIEDERYRTWGGTWGWAKAAFAAAGKAMHVAHGIGTPVLVLQAGDDNLVSNAAENAFAAALPDARLIAYAGAKHELFNATSEIRDAWFRDVTTFFAAHNG